MPILIHCTRLRFLLAALLLSFTRISLTLYQSWDGHAWRDDRKMHSMFAETRRRAEVDEHSLRRSTHPVSPWNSFFKSVLQLLR
jgi:hypothetical protein